MKLIRLSLPHFVVAGTVVGFSAAFSQVTGTALVRHAPSINGTIEGSLHQLLPEGSTLNGGGTFPLGRAPS